MDSNQDAKHWLQTVPGILTGAAALVGAIATLVAALGGFSKSSAPPQANTNALADGCMPPYVWRLAVPSDHICVTEESRRRTEQENQQAAQRRQASGGSYGADTCQTGYVWREAFEGDTVCVLPDRRIDIKRENALAAERAKH